MKRKEKTEKNFKLMRRIQKQTIQRPTKEVVKQLKKKKKQEKQIVIEKILISFSDLITFFKK